MRTADCNKIKGVAMALRVIADYGTLREGEIVSGVPWTTDGNEYERTADNAAYAVTLRSGDEVKPEIVPESFLQPIANRRASRRRPEPIAQTGFRDMLSALMSDGLIRRARDIPTPGPRFSIRWPTMSRSAPVSRFRSVTA